MATVKKKQPYRGFIFEFEPERAGRMADRLSVGYDVSDSFSSDDWKLGRKEVFLILEPDESHQVRSLAGVVFVERMHGTGGTRKPKYRMNRSLFFEPSIKLDQAKERGIDVAGSISRADGGLRLTPELWDALIAFLLEIRPAQSEQLKVLLELVEKSAQLLGGTNKLNRLAEQRDAVGIALDIAGIDRSEIFKQIDADKTDEVDDFLGLLTNYRRQERSLIEHDEQWLQVLLADTSSEAFFQVPGTAATVRVRVTDKEPLETALGVDLLIYHSLYNSLIFIQYKAMNKDVKDGWFYVPDGQLKIQLTAMGAARAAIAKRAKYQPKLAHQRLNSEPFYFKLCERRKPDAAEASLIAGMSMNAFHFEEFLTLPEAQGGPSGGLRVGYKNCYRYFNNTEFVALVKGGWIGTTAAGSDFMKQVITASFEGKHALVYALIEVPLESTAKVRKPRKAK